MESSQPTIKEGYKQTDVGIIPEDWKVKELRDIADVSSGGTPNRQNSTYWNGNIPWITTSQIDFNVITQAEEFITNLGLLNSATKKFPKNSLLMAMYGQGKTRGKVAFLGIEATINQACAAIQINKNVLTEYVFYNLSKRYEEIRGLSNTGNQENLNGNIIKSIQIPLPPLPEQQAIAEVLSDVDALITFLDQLITKKRNIKQGTMQLLLTGKKRLAGFSGEWEAKRLGEIFDISAGGDFIPELSSNVKDGKHRYPIYSNSISNKGLYGFSFYFVYKENAITVTARGTLGVANYRNHKFTAIGRVLVLHPKNLTDCFLVSEVINNRIDFVVESTGVPQLTAPQISSYQILLPSFPEQKAIAKILSDMDAEIEALEKKRDKYKAIKQGMMQELLTGKTRLV
jgi:type I restriction enzyme S subunit